MAKNTKHSSRRTKQKTPKTNVHSTVDTELLWGAIGTLSAMAFDLEKNPGGENRWDKDLKFINDVISAYTKSRQSLKQHYNKAILDTFKLFVAEQIAEIYELHKQGKISDEQRASELDLWIVACEQELKRKITKGERLMIHAPLEKENDSEMAVNQDTRGAQTIAFDRVSFLFGDTTDRATIYRYKNKFPKGVKLPDPPTAAEVLARYMVKVCRVPDLRALTSVAMLSADGFLKEAESSLPMLPSELED